MLFNNITITGMNIQDQNYIRVGMSAILAQNVINVSLFRINFSSNYGFQTSGLSSLFINYFTDTNLPLFLQSNGLPSDLYGVFIMDNCTLSNNTMEDALKSSDFSSLGIMANTKTNYTISNSVVSVSKNCSLCV